MFELLMEVGPEAALRRELEKSHPDEKEVNRIISEFNHDALLLEYALPEHVLRNRHERSAAIQKIANALKGNKACKWVYANFLGLRDEDVRHLAEMLKTKTQIQWLELSGNRITDLGAQYLAEMLEKNKSLLSLCLRNSLLTEKGGRALQQVICGRKNKTLLLCDFGCDGDGEISVLNNLNKQVADHLKPYADGSADYYFGRVKGALDQHFIPDITQIMLDYLDPPIKFDSSLKLGSDPDLLKNYDSVKEEVLRRNCFDLKKSVLGVTVVTFVVIAALEVWYGSNSESFVNFFARSQIPGTHLYTSAFLGIVMGGLLLLATGVYYRNRYQKLQSYVYTVAEQEPAPGSIIPT